MSEKEIWNIPAVTNVAIVAVCYAIVAIMLHSCCGLDTFGRFKTVLDNHWTPLDITTF